MSTDPPVDEAAAPKYPPQEWHEETQHMDDKPTLNLESYCQVTGDTAARVVKDSVTSRRFLIVTTISRRPVVLEINRQEATR